MKKITFAVLISLVMFLPCVAEDTTSYASAEAGDGETLTYAEAWASADEVYASANINDSNTDSEEVVAQTNFEVEDTQTEPVDYQTRAQSVRSPQTFAGNTMAQVTGESSDQQESSVISEKIDTISQLANDTIKQTDIIEKQNAKVLNLFLIALGAVGIILILLVIILVGQRRIKIKLSQNA